MRIIPYSELTPISPDIPLEEKRIDLVILAGGSSQWYFVEDYCKEITPKLDEKRDFILKYGNILTTESITKELTRVEEQTYGFNFFKKLFHKLKLLIEDALREKEL